MVPPPHVFLQTSHKRDSIQHLMAVHDGKNESTAVFDESRHVTAQRVVEPLRREQLASKRDRPYGHRRARHAEAHSVDLLDFIAHLRRRKDTHSVDFVSGRSSMNQDRGRRSIPRNHAMAPSKASHEDPQQIHRSYHALSRPRRAIELRDSHTKSGPFEVDTTFRPRRPPSSGSSHCGSGPRPRRREEVIVLRRKPPRQCQDRQR